MIMEVDEGISPIMRIPPEVRGIIFNKLDQKCAVSLRLVCWQWKSEVDEFVDFSVKLDDRLKSFKRVLELRIKICEVIHLIDFPPLGTATTILKHPNLLRILKIPTDKISSENFHYFLNDSSSFLKKFSVFLTIPLLTFPFPPNLSYNFECLTKLSISVSTVPAEGLRGIPPKIVDNLFHKILEHPMSHLNSFTIELRVIGFTQISSFSAIILAFVAKHWKSLKKFDFDLVQGHGIPSNEIRPIASEDLLGIDMELLSKLNNLEDFRVINSTAVGIDLWAQLLSNQKKLKFMETDILPAPNGLFIQVILNNAKTLVEVDIGDLTIGDPNADDEAERNLPFDLNVFSQCKNLKKLTLDRNSTMRSRGSQTAQVINLIKLPPSIEELAFNYFLIYSEELLLVLNSELGGNLKSLTLSQCGESGVFGVTGTVLHTIIGLQNIQFLEISPLNYSSEEERGKLNLILTAFGFSENHSYIQLNRVQDERPEISDEEHSDF